MDAPDGQLNDEHLRQSVDMMEVDFDTSSFTDDEGYESSPRRPTSPEGMCTGVWSTEEHAKFLEAIKIYSNGPWKSVAAYVEIPTKSRASLRGLRTKQALMRMHFGHHVSEESLVQERLRSVGAAYKSNVHLECEPIPVRNSSPHRRETWFLGADTLPSVCLATGIQSADHTSAEDFASLDVTMLDVKEINPLEDLTTTPTLEDVHVHVLYNSTINNVKQWIASTCPPAAPDGRRHSRCLTSQHLSMGAHLCSSAFVTNRDRRTHEVRAYRLAFLKVQTHVDYALKIQERKTHRHSSEENSAPDSCLNARLPLLSAFFGLRTNQHLHCKSSNPAPSPQLRGSIYRKGHAMR
ncbi:myb-like DNA-binding domain, putative [Phytophthora infestans T30-4]|uniref:Myb-like DNA-binding domain, putative n=1 Tax=Phytophthora infestans (strain T30-4) TaxID=403677 RepID=D0NF10_PHYIT|nr:myb-like DNA-binding domain, putative [Phytophthora infestans T30-4]EEY56799.1 myb-like DNA-binding domain, putative [Phytophthora infestans T30-4]|eukprot:XP_002902127.1 myb-like DNA-binding domain, putative [Phytophthora infestans T30-4]